MTPKEKDIATLMRRTNQGRNMVTAAIEMADSLEEAEKYINNCKLEMLKQSKNESRTN